MWWCIHQAVVPYRWPRSGMNARLLRLIPTLSYPSFISCSRTKGSWQTMKSAGSVRLEMGLELLCRMAFFDVALCSTGWLSWQDTLLHHVWPRQVWHELQGMHKQKIWVAFVNSIVLFLPRVCNMSSYNVFYICCFVTTLHVMWARLLITWPRAVITWPATRSMFRFKQVCVIIP